MVRESHRTQDFTNLGYFEVQLDPALETVNLIDLVVNTEIIEHSKMAALKRFSVIQLVGRGGRIRALTVWRAYSNGTPYSSVPGECITKL